MESPPAKKHPCPDCRMCQWCSDDRCRLCLATGTGCRKKLSMAEQIALYEQINQKDQTPK
jgi:hypothetical protein